MCIVHKSGKAAVYLMLAFQIFAMGASGQGKTDNDGHAFTATHGKKEVVMSKSVSVSRVSMKIGGVSVANNSISQDQEKTDAVKKKLKSKIGKSTSFWHKKPL